MEVYAVKSYALVLIYIHIYTGHRNEIRGTLLFWVKDRFQ